MDIRSSAAAGHWQTFVGVERSIVPQNHITRLLASNRMDLSVPVRWRERLREDSIALPWGHRYEIDLEQAEVAGEIIPVSGGLRLNFYSGMSGGASRGIQG